MSKINKGDIVRFLNEKGEGKVTRIIKDIAYVLIEDGFEIPVSTKELVLIEKSSDDKNISHFETDTAVMNYNYSERNEQEWSENLIDTDETSEPITNDIYMAFTINHDNNDLALFLINDSIYDFNYCLFYRLVNEYKFVDANILESGTKIYTTDIEKDILPQLSAIYVQGILYQKNENSKGKVIEKELKVSTLNLLNNKHFKENDFFDEPAFLLSIIQSEKNIEKLKIEKIQTDIEISKTIPVEEKKNKNTDLLEVDLHIESIVEDYKDLTPTQMLNIQLNHFRKNLEEAILDKNIKKVIFIHGVGNGTLKLELRRILAKEYSHYDYQDASFKEYGYGATMVILRH